MSRDASLKYTNSRPIRSGFFHASEQVIDLGAVIHGIDDEHASGAVDVVQFLAVHDEAIFHHRDVVIRGAFGAGIDGRCRNLRHIAADIAHALHGVKEGMKRMVTNMSQKGFTDEAIADATGLSIDEVRELNE